MRSVLVVDDHVDLSEMVQYVLTHEGYRVILAHDTRSAISAAMRELPHLILLDVMLPDRDGVEMVRSLSKQEDTRNTPVVFLTDLISDKGAAGENNMVVDGETYPVLSKAIGQELLLERIKYFVENG